MARFSSIYVCQQCGYKTSSFLGKCPECESWNSMVEEVIENQKSKSQDSKNQSKISSNTPVDLSKVDQKYLKRCTSGLSEVDRVLGGGIVPGVVVLVSGEPGIGKSTLLLQMAQGLKSKDSKVLYVAGEESASQIKIRAQRLGIPGDHIQIFEETDVDNIIDQIGKIQKENNISLLIIDSIQTLTTNDLSGQAGSVGQVRECSGRLTSCVKPVGIPLFLVGHVTKDGTIAGPKVLEHLVDTVLYFEGDRFESLRLLRAVKNRFGPTDEVGVFEMNDAGLKEINDPHQLLVDLKTSDLRSSGSCMTVTMEGTRPVIVEIQSLVTSTPIPNPRRVATGIDHNRLLAIVAVIQKKLNIPLYKEDIYVSVSGGFKIAEPAIDLAIATAIISSYKNKPIQPSTLAIGELDLLGNIRRVNNLDKRIKEAKRLGFKNVLTCENLASIGEYKF